MYILQGYKNPQSRLYSIIQLHANYEQYENSFLSQAIREYYINITFPARVIVGNIMARNVIINRGTASVDNHISRDDIFDYHPRRECNIYFNIPNRTLDPLFFEVFLLLNRLMMRGDPKGT